MDVAEDQVFTVYRPPKPTNRLASLNYRQNEWKPSISYKHTLDEIRNQMTPAEYYRHRLVTSGVEIRMIQRLEYRWNRKLNEWQRAATKIAAVHRGNVGRAYFKSIQEELIRKYNQRMAKKVSSELFLVADYQGAINHIEEQEFYPVDLLVIKLKCYYKLSRLDEVIELASRIVDMDAECENAYFLKACALAQQQRYQEAHDTIRALVITVDDPKSEVYRLSGFLSSKLDPPAFEQGIDSFDILVRKKPKDFEALIQRATCFACLQEWNKAIKDLSFVLMFKPDCIQARMLRARIYSCTREWDKSRKDYTDIIEDIMHPSAHETARKALEDIEMVSVDMPMMDERLLTNEL